MTKKTNVTNLIAEALSSLKEKLSADDDVSVWIKDFQDSDDSRFEGKSKEERRDMALAAYSAAKKDVKEEKEEDKEEKEEDDKEEKEDDDKEEDKKDVKEEKEDDDDKEDDEDEDEDEELDAEIKETAKRKFEEAVAAKVKEIHKELSEAYETRLAAAISEAQEKLASTIDSYVDVVVERWILDNELAVNTGLKFEIYENLIKGIQGVFESNNVVLDESDESLIESLSEELNDTRMALKQVREEHSKLVEEKVKTSKEEIFARLSEGLYESQKEKLHALAEAIDTDDVGIFESRLVTLKNTFFLTEKSKSSTSGAALTEGLGNKQIDSGREDDTVTKYAQFIRNSINGRNAS